MSVKRLVAVTLLVALVATGCSGAAGSPGGGSGATGDAPEDQTAWERVVTAMDEQSSKEHVFTNIDSVVIAP